VFADTFRSVRVARTGPAAPLALAYGEVAFRSFLCMLRAAAMPASGGVFVDLGSGAGKAVLACALLYPRSRACVGVEIVPHLVTLARGAAAAAAAASLPAEIAPVDMIEGSLTECGTDGLRSADVVFAAATCFDAALFAAMQARCGALMRVGARLIVTSQALAPDARFALRHSALYRMAWEGNVTVFLYERV
jgi:hypothetical protein